MTSDPDRRQALDDVRQLLPANDAPVGIEAALIPAAPQLNLIGRIESSLKSPGEAPKQGDEGAPDAWISIDPAHATGLRGLQPGDSILVLTWLDRADRTVLEVHPRDDLQNPKTGVFRTRSADRPNPIGLHPVKIRQIAGNRLLVGPLDAIDGTPVIDMKPVI